MADSSGDEGGSRGAGLMAAGQIEGRRACLVAAGRRQWRDRRSRRRERRRQRQKGGGEVEVIRGRLMKRKGGRVFRRVRQRQKADLNRNEEEEEEEEEGEEAAFVQMGEEEHVGGCVAGVWG